MPQVAERSWYFIKLYRHYKNKILFTEGGLLSQPQVYLEAMEIIDG